MSDNVKFWVGQLLPLVSVGDDQKCHIFSAPSQTSAVRAWNLTFETCLKREVKFWLRTRSRDSSGRKYGGLLRGEPLVRKSRTCEAKEKIRGVWLDSQAASADDLGWEMKLCSPATRSRKPPPELIYQRAITTGHTAPTTIFS